MQNEDAIEEFDSESSQSERNDHQKTIISTRGKRQKMQRVGGKKSKVDAVLEECGVNYTHANRAVVRATKAESHMSKRAMKDVFELKQYSQQPANCFATMECSSEESDDVAEETTQKSKPKRSWSGPRSTLKPRKTHNTKTHSRNLNQSVDTTTEQIDDAAIFVGKTPRGIRKQHFGEIGKALGFPNDIDFARYVVEQDESEHLDMLKQFYTGKYPELQTLKCFSDSDKTSSEPKRKRHIGSDVKVRGGMGSDVSIRARTRSDVKSSDKSGRGVREGAARKGNELKDGAREKRRVKVKKRIQYEDDSDEQEETPVGKSYNVTKLKSQQALREAHVELQESVSQKLKAQPENTAANESEQSPCFSVRVPLPNTSILDDFIPAGRERDSLRDSCVSMTARDGDVLETGARKWDRLQKSILDDFI